MRMKTIVQKGRRLGAVLTALAMLLGLFPTWTAAADTAPTPKVTFTFTDSGITADSSTATGYSIDGTTLTISASGTYGVTGSCSEGSIVIKASTTGVKLVMTDLTLSCSSSAPLLCKKASGVTLWLSGTSTLTDNENPEDEDSTDETVADAFEGAAIKVNKDGASLLIKGSGSLTADGSSCKNGIKAGAESTITVSGGTLNIKAANNGLAADGAVIIKGGTLSIDADNDGIKSSPDDDDTTSEGTITIYDGDITINADSDGINAAGDITIYGGTFDITAQSDGIQTDSNLTISDGTFNITTLDGYNSSSFNSDTMSCKGLKASYSDDEDSDTSEADNTITISGGTFTLDTADDAIHSDAYIEITGGKFTINTGDDGVHADTTLILGTSGGTVARDPDIMVNHSYEGLEAGTVYIYSGRHYVVASDDGINAAGGSGSGTDPQGGGGNNFNPGGGFPGGGRGGRMMSLMSANGGGTGGQNGIASLMDMSYSLNIAGGHVYVNADGDGLDSNGALTLTGGRIEVWGQSSGDNEPLDYDGTLTVNGATIFAAGCAGMGVASPSGGSQSYVSYGGTSGGFGGGPGGGNSGGSSASISSSALISVTNGSTAVYQASAPKSVSYVFFSSPNTTSSYSISSGSGAASCLYGNDWIHTWNSGTVTTDATSSASGVRTYTCSVCGATETETIPMLVTIPEDADDSDDTGDETDEGYTITFATDGHATVNVYYTQDYTEADETDVTSTVSRNSDTGAADSTGEGQVNFTIVPADGYSVDSITVTDGTYKNIKGPDDTGLANTYRVTKITADTTVIITTTADSGGDTGDDTRDETDEGFTVTFATDGHATVNVYYTQDYTTADETDVASTVSRNSDTGAADSTGDGQVNFTVIPADGYTVDSVTVTEGTYKNIKGPDDTGLANTYRVTKITADTTVTITTTADSGGDTGDDDVSVESISVKTNPTKTTYTVGDSFDPSGLILTVTYSDSTTDDVAYSASAGMTFSGFDSSSAGTKTVTVTYEGKTAAFSVTVNASSGTGDDTGSGSQGQPQGCYVATAVYGSYDCPEVWTLRRYRDEVLGETWYGRLFIWCYYAVSPTAVRLFGENAWFQDFWRGRLDSMVSQLQEVGFASTPYEDLNW